MHEKVQNYETINISDDKNSKQDGRGRQKVNFKFILVVFFVFVTKVSLISLSFVSCGEN